jgi:S1-C subfamily serine protease
MPTTLESLSNDLAGAVERAGTSVVAIHARRRIPASGVVWRAGLVVAADHTIHKDEDIRLSLANGDDARARLIGRDPGTDLCLLRLPDDARTTPASLNVEPLRVGQLAMTVGRPGENATASLGVISVAGPEWRTWRGGRIDQFIRLDVAVYDGFSGSPLVNAAGEIAGICTSGLARGAAVAVPAVTVNRIVDQLLASGGTTRRGFLGIGTQAVLLPEALRERIGRIGGREPSAGLMVVAVQPGTAADRAGILLGDLIVALGDELMEDARDVFGVLGPESVGHELRAIVVRAGAPITVSITVDEHPARN